MLIIELKPWGKSRRMEISLQYIRVCVCVCVCVCTMMYLYMYMYVHVHVPVIDCNKKP